MFETKDQVMQSLLGAGISVSTASALAAQAKPCVRIKTSRVISERCIAKGDTKIGGRPDLPPELAWPHRGAYPDAEQRIMETAEQIKRSREFRTMADESHFDHPGSDKAEKARTDAMKAEAARTAQPRPLSFIAQVDLAQISCAGPIDEDIPTTGHLLLFYDADIQPWGFRPGDVAGGKLLYHKSDSKSLKRARIPSHTIYFEPLRCQFHQTITPVPPGSFEHRQLPRDDAENNRLYDWFFDLIEQTFGQEWGYHQIGGQPLQIQGDMQLECQLVAHGLEFGSENPDHVELEAKLTPGARDWLLLLQFTTDEDAGMFWGSGGNIYVWIHREDLRAQQFEKARVILQCT